MGRFWSSSLATLPLCFNCGFTSTSACGSSTGDCSWGCPGGLGSAPARARCGGGAAAWVTGVLASPGTQGSWWLGQQELWCSRRVWQPVLADTLQYSCLENHSDREAWQATVHRDAKSWTQLRLLHVHRCKTFFFFCLWHLCRSEVVQLLGFRGPLAVPNVQGHRLPQLQELRPDQGLFLSLWRSKSLWPVFLHSAAVQALGGLPCLGSSVVPCVGHLAGPTWLGSSL